MSDQLKDKLQHYEVSPPPGVWAAVARELKDANQFLPLSNKLYDHEVAPPAMAWSHIREAVNITAPAESLPPVRRIKPIYKVGVAAAIVGVVLLGSFYFYNNNPLKKNTFLQTSSSDNEPKSGNSGETAPAVESESEPAPPLMATAYPVHKSKRSSSRNNTKTLRSATIKDGTSFGTELAIMIAAKPIRDDEGDIIQDVNLMRSHGKKYINVTGPNGKQTKISSKFLNVLLYMNDDSNVESYEGYFDKAFVESLVWKTRFEEWRKKLIQNSFIPSSSNYFDILEFRDLILKEKEE